MILFWSLAALLLAVTLAVLVVPLLRRHAATDAPDVDAAATAVYRDQKQALDAEYADGIISATEREAAIGELSHRLGEEIGSRSGSTAPVFPRRSAWILAGALVVVIPSIAVMLYARLGRPEAIVGPATEPAHEMSAGQVNALVETLAQRLQTRPDDPQGWLLLARSYHALGRFDEAAQAYARASALIQDDPGLLADYADVLAMTQGRRLAGRPTELAKRALALDPNHKKALALAATAAMEARDFDGALALWKRLGAQFSPDSEDARQVTAIIAEVEGLRGGKASPPTADARSRAAAVAGGTIAGRVDVAPGLASKVALTDTVFIFARAAEGSRMPLAILRVPAKQLPMDFRLDDSMGMAGAKLSEAKTVVVEARISKSGNATPQAGDLSGKSAAVSPGASSVNVLIDQVVR